jgi:hypothetical protein
MPDSIAEIKARQSAKISQIIQALTSAGICSLDEQAVALGLNRSTVWNMRRGNHKGSGLSPKIIHRMLSSTQLPLSVRAKIDEYVEEKAAGNFGPVTSRGRVGGTIPARGIEVSRSEVAPKARLTNLIVPALISVT